MPYLRLYYHLVWSTQNRLPRIAAQEEVIIRRSFDLTCDDLKLIPHAVGFMPDHLHVAVSIPPSVTLSESVRRLKGASSHAVNKFIDRTNGQVFSWQGEYGALTFGDLALPYVVTYIQDQARRHAEQRTIKKMERFEPLN